MTTSDSTTTIKPEQNTGNDAASSLDLSRQEVLDLHMQGDLEAAKKGYLQLVNRGVADAAVYSNLAAMFIETKNFAEAAPLIQKALSLDPGHVYSHLNFSHVLMEIGRLQEAAFGFQKVFNLDNTKKGALCNYWSMRMKMCDWSDYKQMQQEMYQAVREQKINTAAADISNEIAPFTMLSMCDDPELHLKISRDFVQSKTCMINRVKPLFRSQKKAVGDQVKIAFVSADFKKHPAGFLIAELFELINPQQFEVHAISMSESDHSSVRQRIETAASYFHDVNGQSDQVIAQLIADLGIDIAIDCHGHTAACRPRIFALRPAPIQVNQIGYPGTLGADYVDYIMADPFLIPEGKQSCYSEKIAYLPDTIQLNDRQRVIAKRQPTRDECNLPEDAFVFCSFNNSHKITPEIFHTWVDLLEQTENSILWLYADNDWAKKNLQAEMQKRMIEPSRMIFAEKLPYDQHLARIKNADLFLDTLPYNAHSSANDALWMGLPLITLSGQSFAARVAGSNLKAVGLEELITNDLDSYKSLALDLATQPKKLEAIRKKLTADRMTCALFDMESMVKNMEKAYQYMADRYRSDQEPETFYVQTSGDHFDRPALPTAKTDLSHRSFAAITGKKDFTLQDVVNTHVAGRIDLARSGYQAFIDSRVQNPIPYSNLASILFDENKFEEAIPLLRTSLKIDSEYVDAHVKLAAGLEVIENGKSPESIPLLEKAIQLEPDYALSHLLIAQAWMKRNNSRLAIQYFQSALSLDPQMALAHYNLATELMKIGELQSSAKSFKRAFELDPQLIDAISKVWSMHMKMCDWSEFESLQNTLLTYAAKKTELSNLSDASHVLSPFSLLSSIDDPALHRKVSEDHAKSQMLLVDANKSLFKKRSRAAHQPIRLGFVSADLYEHAVGYLIAELFELIDKEQFEIQVFSLNDSKKSSPIRQRLKAACQYFHNVEANTDREIAQMIADRGIDIAIDCHGYTEKSRTTIFAMRPAPIQVNQIGYPSTMGAGFIDYMFADPFLIPENKRNCYSEKIAYLPDTIQINDRKRLIATEQPSRQQCELPDDAFVFCCFNNNHKILPDIFLLWMDLLREIPDSVLWLYESNRWVKDNFRTCARQQGIDSSRLIFAKQVPYDQHLARSRNADLFLDTLPYNAHSTANDALWVGLPLVTCAGNSFTARVAGSNLKAAGLEELITHDLDAYRALALELARNPEKLQQIRNQLISHRDTCPLFDTKNLVRNFEKAYGHMYELYQTGQSPETFFVSDLLEPQSSGNDAP